MLSGSKVRRSLTNFLQRHCIPKYFGSQLTPPPIFQNRRCHQEHAAPVKWVFLIKPPSLPLLPSPQPRPALLFLVQLNEISDICEAESRSEPTDEKRTICSATPGRNRIPDVFHLRRCGRQSPLFRLDLVGRRRRPDTYIFIRPRMAELQLHNEWGQGAALCFFHPLCLARTLRGRGCICAHLNLHLE